jgi:opacity protein-like surface antigen
LINELPLNGRNYQDLLNLRPGVVAYPGGGTFTQSADGVRPDGINWLVDGQLNSDPEFGRSVIGVQSPFRDAATLLPIDAIQEFSVEVNPKAETGWKPGAAINVGIKSGTNHLHGTAYAFGRDSAWDARNYFNPTPNPQSPLNLIQYGATAGGPIKKDRLFFFGAYETYNDEIANPRTISAPEQVSSGDPSSSIPDAIAALQANGIPISSVSRSLLNLYPTNSTASTLVNTNFSNSNTSYNGIGKLTYYVSDHNTISGMLFWSQYQGIGEDQPYANERFLLHVPIKTVAVNLNWIHTFGPSWVNEARFGFNRVLQGDTSGDSSVAPTTYGLNTGTTNPASFGLPTLHISGFAPLGAFIAPYSMGPNPFYRGADHISYFHGNHAIKLGAELAHGEADIDGLVLSRGILNFTGGQAFPASSGLEDFLAGMPSLGLFQVGSDPARFLKRWQYAAFIQDDWRVTSRFTLNLGLRYEYSAPPSEANGNLGNFDPARGLVQTGKQIGTIYNGDHKNFAPRVGLAWDLTGKGTTVLRAGASVMYETVILDSLTRQFLQNGVTSLGNDPTGALLNGVPGPGNIARTLNVYGGSQLNYPLAPGATATIFPTGPQAIACTTDSPCSALGIDSNFKTPFVTTWTAGIQHAFTSNLSLELNYIGNHGSRLLGAIDLNAPPAGAGYCLNSPLTAAQNAAGCSSAGTSALEQAARPFNKQFPYLGNINWLGNFDRSNYHGLQATLTERLSHGLSFLAGYTFSHALDTGSLNSFGSLPLNSASGSRNSEYASSDFDIRHHFTLAITYTLPGIKSPGQLLKGWQINANVNLQSGQPWTINDLANDYSGTGDFADRWNFFGNPSDFQSGTTSGIPFFAGTSNANCLSQATAMGPGAVSALATSGCFARGNSILIPPAPGTFGNAGRNAFRDRGFKSVNMSVYKNWRFKEGYGVQFRAEFFNVFNHPNFANPYGGPSGYGSAGFNDPSSGGAGVFGCGCATPDVAASNPVVGSGSMRAIQLGLKVIF